MGLFFLSQNRSSTYAAVIIIIVALAALAVTLYLVNFNVTTISPDMPIPLVSTARNWAGYIVATNFLTPKSAVESVSATWTVPAASNTGSDGYSSCWVGVGGQFDHTLIQVGTEQDNIGGVARYSAWYEMLPANSVTIQSIQVSAGDQIQASVTLVNATENLWSISITDLSNHGAFQSNFNYNSQRLTTEWIVERPEINGALAPLAGFGGVTFTNCHATLNGKTGGITSFNRNYVTLDPESIGGRTVQLVHVGHTSNSGTQFTVRYTAT